MQRDELFAQIVSENLQLKRTLWLVLRTSGNPTLTVDQKDMRLLWDLQYSSVPDEPNKLTLTANLLPEATDHDIARLREMLVDTDKSLHEIRKGDVVNRPDLPLAYLQMRLMEGVEGIIWNSQSKKWTRIPLPAQEPPPSPTHATV